jgi:diguanylate cyclase (GGDEF)-like protein
MVVDTSSSLDYRHIWMAAPGPHAILSPDLRFIDVNADWLSLVQGSRENYIGHNVFEAVPPRMQEAARELKASFSRVMERRCTDRVSLLHYPLYMASESSAEWQDRYWSVTNIPLFYPDGNVFAILNCPVDVTEAVLDSRQHPQSLDRNAAAVREQLANERRRLRQLMQQAPGFVAVGDGPEFVFELANDAYYQLVGHRDIIGKPVREALPELAGQGFYELLDQVYSSGNPFIGRAMPIQLQPAPGAPLVKRYIDFIYQPIRDDDGAVSGIFVQGHDVTEAFELSVRITHQAMHDALTGLANRREFESRLERAVDLVPDDTTRHSLLYLDLDQFKVVNDTCGHAAGDELLRQIADELRRHVPAEYTLARLGGDEFGLLLENTDAQAALIMAESLRAAVDALEFARDQRVFGCSASVGVVTFGAEIGGMKEVLSAADAACFLAKDKGRNRVQVHTPHDGELAMRRREMDWVGRLRDALAEDRMFLLAQRIVPLAPRAEGRSRMELLLRLRDVDGSIVPPMAFIPAAERYGIMPGVDRYVIRSACEFLSNLAPFERSRTALSVNLSGRTLSDERLLPFISELQALYRICPGEICFEVTETAAVHDLSHTARLLHSMRDMGFGFALDDFGSGMSSFGYLKHLPFDYLKIDGVFIRNIRNDPADAAMVGAIAKVAKVMGIQTVAEYVGDEATSGLLATLGVDYAQGYGVHVPTPLDRILAQGIA